MAKAILICGKICAGKSTYAEQLRQNRNAVILSVDEVMLTIFGQHCGDRHDEYAAGTQKYLYAKSLELLGAGIDVILDWGFWTGEVRSKAKEYYKRRGIACELHYIDTTAAQLAEHIKKRNTEVEADESLAYYVDGNLLNKLRSRFEVPGADEADVWVKYE